MVDVTAGGRHGALVRGGEQEGGKRRGSDRGPRRRSRHAAAAQESLAQVRVGLQNIIE